MKTEPLKHQVEGCAFLAERPDFAALGAEQGTGKTWMFMKDAETRYLAGDIELLLVCAPKGVHLNWVKREIPLHVSVPVHTDYWLSGMGVRHKRRLEKILALKEEAEEDDEVLPLIVVAVNIDAFNQKAGRDYCVRLLKRYKGMMIVDESHLIKNPSSSRTKHVSYVGEFAVSRRIGSGTLVANSPMDLFGQYEFLRSGLLGTTSFVTFRSEYSELLPPTSNLVRGLAKKKFHKALAGLEGAALEAKLNSLIKNGRGLAPIPKVDKEGNPIYKNLAKLRVLIAPHTFRVLKKDCLDLPKKIYQTHYFSLAPSHKKFYDRVQQTMRHEREDGLLDIYSNLTLSTKLQQITSGYIIEEGAPADLQEPDTGLLTESDARMSALLDAIELIPEGKQFIVWARYREEIRRIADMLKDYGVAQYHGGVSNAAREEALDGFQAGDYRGFVANAASGGAGLTLTAAEFVFYYSQSFSLTERLQSEDRCHRIGTVNPVVYTDLAAMDTIDERITSRLQFKEGVAEELLDF